jgi:hypothetical protein
MSEKAKVILRRVPDYDPALIRKVIREGIAELGLAGRVPGCPPKHKDIVLWFFLKAGILNPMVRLDLIWDAYPCLFFTWCRRFVKGRF